MGTLAAGLDYIDLQFLGTPEIIASAVIHGSSGVALIDPGPSTTLAALKAGLATKGLSVGDIRSLLITHIHLDHAGAAGTLVKENPSIAVFVHEAGAPHMADPSRLLASASRLYLGDMERLWGEMLPVPDENLHRLAGGERIDVCGRQLAVAYTPGHASHHVSYFDPSTRIAFVGDTAGIRRGQSNFVLPPTPPPDIDLEVWRESESRILSWDPDTLFLTHFGPFHSPRVHFQQLREHLDEWSRIANRLLANSTLDDQQRQAAFVDQALRHLQRAVGPQEAERYSRAGRLDYSWQGLARYWRRKSARD